MRSSLWPASESHTPTNVDPGSLDGYSRDRAERGERGRVVVRRPSRRARWNVGATAAKNEVLEIADDEPIPFPGFDRILVDHATLHAALTEPRDASWKTALASVVGVYVITDTRDGRRYIGKADGAERIAQRWAACAQNGNDGKANLQNRDSATFRHSLLSMFDPNVLRPSSMPQRHISRRCSTPDATDSTRTDLAIDARDAAYRRHFQPPLARVPPRLTASRHHGQRSGSTYAQLVIGAKQTTTTGEQFVPAQLARREW